MELLIKLLEVHWIYADGQAGDIRQTVNQQNVLVEKIYGNVKICRGSA